MAILLSLFFFSLFALGVAAFALERKGKNAGNDRPAAAPDGECCGAHAVCERNRLVSADDKIVYYDDEELDALAGRDDFSDEEKKMLEDVFYTLRESDVAGWLCSLQLRDIRLPADLRDAALLIVSERRAQDKEHYDSKHKSV